MTFNPLENNMAWQVWRFPERYDLIKGSYRGQDTYVERRNFHGYDKHFWVEASEVEKIREHYEKEATNDTARQNTCNCSSERDHRNPDCRS